MSRYFNSFMDDSSEELEHSWGTSPEAKAREKEYNHWYYQKHKDDIAEVRKQRSAATNSYKQAEKSKDAARRYKLLWSKTFDKEYARKYINSRAKIREYKTQGARQKASANGEAEKILRGLKNPTVKDLVEFYFDTTVEKAKKSASKAKKYATKAMSSAEKAAKKYATEAMSTAEKSARKAKKYATKTIKSVVR